MPVLLFRANRLLLLALPIVTVVSLLIAFKNYHSSLKDLRPIAQADAPRPFSHYQQEPDTLVPADSPNNVFYFVQLSDIHVSKYINYGGLSHLVAFLEDELPALAPDFVLVTGDLTDAKDRDRRGSKQLKEEWIAYHTTLERSGVLNRVGTNNRRFWWDQRGNHDCFDVVAQPGHPSDFFSQFSSTKKDRYNFIHLKGFGTYSFVGMNGCPRYGLRRPFNFFSIFERNDMDLLEAALKLSGDKRANHTFVTSHYPTALTLFGRTSSGKSFQELSRSISLYLCGHLHKLFWGLGEKLYAYHKGWNFLELELGDIKNHGVFRIMAVDHDLVSFTDVVLQLPRLPLPARFDISKNPSSVDIHMDKPVPSHRPPIVLITNPKNSQFALPTHEPSHRLLRSTHIRILVWPSLEVTFRNVEIWIDGKRHQHEAIYTGTGGQWDPMLRSRMGRKALNDTNAFSRTTTADGDETAVESEYIPLWVARWNPGDFDDGREHLVTVNATDENGLVGSASHIFRVDGQQSNMQSSTGKNIIQAKWIWVFQALFFIAYTSTMLILLIPKLHIAWLNEKAGGAHGYLRYRRVLSETVLNFDEILWIKDGIGRTIHPALALDRSNFEKLERYFGGRARIRMPWTWARTKNAGAHFLHSYYLRFCELSTCPEVWYPLYYYGLYIIAMPWFLGDFVPAASTLNSPLITGTRSNWLVRYGWFKLCGIHFLDDTWIPIGDTWVHAVWEQLQLFFPVVIYLSHCVTTPTLLYCSSNPRRFRPLHTHWICGLSVFFYFAYQIRESFLYRIYYGWVAIIVSPARSWWLVWVLYTTVKWSARSSSTRRLNEQEPYHATGSSGEDQRVPAAPQLLWESGDDRWQQQQSNPFSGSIVAGIGANPQYLAQSIDSYWPHDDE
ncbi:hypothetical protein BJ742DRAFT_704781 [Cladochytrium replicatum]|nr:hypothetical protein BJ742DRAFT_704781 [Cladochytrium replicatum]